MANTVLDRIISPAFEDINQIEVGVTPSSGEQAKALTALNAILGQLGAEGLIAYTQTVQAFTLSAGVGAYTLGTAGTWATSVRPQKVTGWQAYSGVMRKGGAALALADFDAAAQAKATELHALNAQALAEGIISTYPPSLTAPIPSVLGADTSYPNINIRIFPVPNNTPGLVEVAYWTTLSKFAATSDTLSLPDGWEYMLRTALALALYPAYPREGLDITVLASNAQNAKAAIAGQNNMQRPAPQQGGQQ